MIVLLHAFTEKKIQHTPFPNCTFSKCHRPFSLADGKNVQLFKTIWDLKRIFYTVPVEKKG